MSLKDGRAGARFGRFFLILTGDSLSQKRFPQEKFNQYVSFSTFYLFTSGGLKKTLSIMVTYHVTFKIDKYFNKFLEKYS